MKDDADVESSAPLHQLWNCCNIFRDALVQINYTVQVWKEDGQFIAHAMPLDVASSGPTPAAARKAVDEAVRLFLATAARHGTLKEVLEDAGYRRVRREWRGPAWLGLEQRSCLAEV